jgi:stage II sporulation protein P
MRQLKLPKFFRFLTLVLLLLSGCYFFLDWLFWRQPPGFFFNARASRELLCAAMPMVSLVDGGGNSGTVAGKSPSFGPATSALLSLLGSFRVEPSDPVSVLRLAVPFLAQFEPPEKNSSPPAVPASPPHFAPPSRESTGAAFSAREIPVSAGKADVLIYHTHTGETYALTDGKERLDGKRGGVVQAGAAVKEILEARYGLKVVQSTKIHDADYGTAYLESEKTLRQLLSAYPGAKVVLDIHRDAGRPRENSLVKINGQEVAPVLFIVGSDARLPFPTQEQNKKFAGELAEKMNAKYPGLCLGVRVSDGRYNQHLHPRAVLVEMGSACNSTEEAVAGARLFADVLGELVLEILKNRE